MSALSLPNCKVKTGGMRLHIICLKDTFIDVGRMTEFRQTRFMDAICIFS